jgi:hypothetical protein
MNLTSGLMPGKPDQRSVTRQAQPQTPNDEEITMICARACEARASLFYTRFRTRLSQTAYKAILPSAHHLLQTHP